MDAQIVGEVISAWTGIPIGKMLKDEVATVLNLEEHLGKRVIGQGHALEGISQRIRTARAGLDDPNKPVGVFLLVGPSGVGKTETALALSDLLYGGEHNLITINMSEFQEAHTVSTLKGSPPGYVGYGEGGVLTEAVRRRPYSVVLLDEVEKAHPDVLELFFQVFDKGMMEDGEGRQIDFKNTIIILTSNAGTDTLMKLCADPETMPDAAGLVNALKPELNKIFKPAFLGRLVIIPYFPIRDEALQQIIVLKLGKIQRRLQETHRIDLTYDEALVEEVAPPLHGSRKRRPQRGQHPDEHASARHFEAVAGPHRGRAEAPGDSRIDWRKRRVRLRVMSRGRPRNPTREEYYGLFARRPADSNLHQFGRDRAAAGAVHGNRVGIRAVRVPGGPAFGEFLRQSQISAAQPGGHQPPFGGRRDPLYSRHL